MYDASLKYVAIYYSIVARHGAGGGGRRPPTDLENLQWESLSVISSHWIKVRISYTISVSPPNQILLATGL